MAHLSQPLPLVVASYTGMQGLEQRFGFGAGGSAQPRRQTLPRSQSALLAHGLSRLQAELRSVQAAWNESATNAPQPHCPLISFGQ